MATKPCNTFSIEQLRDLSRSPQEAAKVVLPLLKTLTSDDDELAGWATDALRTVTEIDSHQASEVLALCRSQSPALAAWACKMLVRAVPQETAYEQAIVSVLGVHDALSARQEAALVLASLPELCPESILALRKAATSDDPRLARLANQTLTTIPSS